MVLVPSLESYQLAGVLLGALAVWSASVAIYRIYFDPLSHVPGPKIAAATGLYIFYYNVIRDGLFYLELDGLHKKYGIDPDNYDKIYYIGSKYTKDATFYVRFGAQDNSWATSTNENHRRLRAPMEPFFSRRTVLELEDIAQEKAAKICRVVENGISKGESVDLHAGFRAISMDILTEYAFDDCWDQLDRPDLGQWFSDLGEGIGSVMHISQQFPFFLQFSLMMPQWLMGYLSSDMKKTVGVMERTALTVEGVKAKMAKGEKPKRRTIFHDLLDPEINQSGHSTLSSEALVEEAFALCAAASDTTGNAMSVAVYHVLNDAGIHKALSAELVAAFPDATGMLEYTTLEKLPYLGAVIKEGQRLSYGVCARLPRVVPAGGATFNGLFIPPGYTASMSAYNLHRNPAAFPDPAKFDPTRWLPTADPQALAFQNKCFVPFSRGSRGCIGQNLAMCELYVTLGTFFRRFGPGKLKTRDVGELTFKDRFSPYHRREEERLKVWGTA
ncbi:hypothetical protein OQA88_3445 [Cercophora sp. LCS_1]